MVFRWLPGNDPKKGKQAERKPVRPQLLPSTMTCLTLPARGGEPYVKQSPE